MNLDTRARRAAEGVRASTGGVDPMAQLTELKHESRTRRRNNSALAVVGVAVLVAGAGWLTASQLRASDDPAPTDPLSTPSTSPSVVRLEPGPTVGTRLEVPLVAKAPASWTVWKDGAFVYIDADGSEQTLGAVGISGPILQVFDPKQRTGVPVPPEGYAAWLREHPKLRVLDERMVVVDGQRFPQLTVMMANAAPGDEVPLGLDSDKPVRRAQWPDYSKGEVATLTVIEVGGMTMEVSSAILQNSPNRNELDAGLDLVLSTMKLPN